MSSPDPVLANSYGYRVVALSESLRGVGPGLALAKPTQGSALQSESCLGQRTGRNPLFSVEIPPSDPLLGTPSHSDPRRPFAPAARL